VFLRYAFFLLLICSSYSYAGQSAPKHYVVEGWIDNSYVPTLLSLILEASKAPDEVIELKYNKLYDLQLSPSRRIAEFAKLKGNMVMWTVTTKDYEAFLQPIRVPIFKGLFGYRGLIIRKEDQVKFAGIKSQKKLASLVAGQGEQWPDTDVLRANNFSVVTGLQTDNLYKMLAAKRFDYFPRALVEIEEEQAMIDKYDLMIAPNLLLEYPNPMYFFVQKNNTELAKRLVRGWNIILNNGTFDQLFFSQPRIKKAMTYISPIPRYIAHLKVPELPKETPLKDFPYWLPMTGSHTLPP